MPVTIANSVGYDGTIQEPDWARLMVYAGGRQYGVVAPADWKVTPGAADREIRLRTVQVHPLLEHLERHRLRQAAHAMMLARQQRFAWVSVRNVP